MNFLDVLLIVPLIYAGYKGFKHGLIIEVFTLMALFLGLYAGINFSDFVAGKLKDIFGWDSPYAPTICFTVIFLGIGAMVYFAGVMIQRMVRVVNLSPIDKFFGVFFGVLKMTYILSVILVLIESYDEKGDFFPEEKKDGSLLYHPVKNLSTYTVPGLDNSTIFIKNAFKEESDSTGLTVDQVLRAKEVADSLGIDANDAVEIKRVYDEHLEKK
ncbi:MAG: CvpA family protein [Bacteroidetes bacterium]|nr:MAG: CvpA family protein [Bacteroidota bacterium]